MKTNQMRTAKASYSELAVARELAREVGKLCPEKGKLPVCPDRLQKKRVGRGASCVMG